MAAKNLNDCVIGPMTESSQYEYVRQVKGEVKDFIAHQIMQDRELTDDEAFTLRMFFNRIFEKGE